MKKGHLFVFLFIAVCYSAFSYASNFGNDPDFCPSVSAIQSEGMTSYQKIVAGLFITYHASNYQTSAHWVFILGPLYIDDEAAVIEEGNKLLYKLYGTPHPSKDEDGNWICEYDMGDSELFAYAVDADDMDFAQDLRKIPNLFLKKYV